MAVNGNKATGIIPSFLPHHTLGVSSGLPAPCMPTDLQLSHKNESCASVSWTGNNRAANYTVTAHGDNSSYTCTSSGNSCDLTELPCGSSFEVNVFATSDAGQSLLSYSDYLETRERSQLEATQSNSNTNINKIWQNVSAVATSPRLSSSSVEPCCPKVLEVFQATQSLSYVYWSDAKGAFSLIVSLTSPRGHARCHTEDGYCVMGCITCGTNYTVTMEVFSRSGRSSNCSYQGFSSSESGALVSRHVPKVHRHHNAMCLCAPGACCPSGVRLYRMADNSMRVHWRSAGSSYGYIAEMRGSNNFHNNYNCSASPGESSCDISNVQCGDSYEVVVAPLTLEGHTVSFCPQRLYSGMSSSLCLLPWEALSGCEGCEFTLTANKTRRSRKDRKGSEIISSLKVISHFFLLLQSLVQEVMSAQVRPSWMSVNSQSAQC